MKRKDDVFRYLGQILTIFGFSVVFLSIISFFAGESAKDISTMFALGNQGLSLPTLAQFFMLSVLITTLQFILFSDGLICRIPLAVRTFLMFFLIILLVALFVWMFGWFPVDMLEAWGYFFIFFAACSLVSTYIMVIKTDRENKQMEEALKKLKEEKE